MFFLVFAGGVVGGAAFEVEGMTSGNGGSINLGPAMLVLSAWGVLSGLGVVMRNLSSEGPIFGDRKFFNAGE